jgi:hypothetical protein
VADRVPVIVLNVTNPADPGNVVAGIVGTNVLSGRNLVIDPDPSIGGGNLGPQLYISDAVTTEANWNSAFGTNWGFGASWSTGTVPGVLTIANVRFAPGVDQLAVVTANYTAWEINVSGASESQSMTLRVHGPGGKLTTFAGLNVEQFGHVQLVNGMLDVQNVDIRDGGRLSGNGSIFTGSGPIPGQVENVSGVVAPRALSGGLGQDLNIEGRYSNGIAGTLEIEARDLGASRLAVIGPATLAGTLRVVIPSGAPQPIQATPYTILTATEGIAGKFDVLDLPTLLLSDRVWFVDYNETDVTLKVTLPGDFDGDFDVDAADLPIWEAGYGTTHTGADFLAWQRNLGRHVGISAPVPEPASAGLVSIALASYLGARRKQRPT